MLMMRLANFVRSACAALAVMPAAALGQDDWELVTSSSDLRFSVNAGSFRREGALASARVRIEDKQPAEATKYDTEIALFTANCTSAQYKFEYGILYKRGQVVSTRSSDPVAWSDAKPNTVASTLVSRVCRGAQPPPAPQAETFTRKRLGADEDGDEWFLEQVKWTSESRFDAIAIVTINKPFTDSGKRVHLLGFSFDGDCRASTLRIRFSRYFDDQQNAIRDLPRDSANSQARQWDQGSMAFSVLDEACRTRGFRVAAADAATPGDRGRRPANGEAAPPRASSGTGFFVSARGHLLTNQHVIRDCQRITVTTSTQQRHTATLQASDPKNDLALIHINASAPAVAQFRTTPVKPGEPIVALGYPLRGLLANEANVSTGTVSALAGLLNDVSKLQIQAPVQPGNSGGPLFDMTGAVVGVVLEKLDAMAVAKATGDIPQNVNFGVKGEIARLLLQTADVEARDAPPTGPLLSAPAVAQRGRPMTALIECQR